MEAIAASSEGAAAEAATRVLLVAPRATGGLARHVVALMKGLAPGGCELAVACEPDGPIAEAAGTLSVPICAVKCSSGAAPSQVAASAVRLARAMNEMRPHIVHTHSFTASAMGAIASTLTRSRRLVATVHNYPPNGDTMRPRRARDRWAVGLAVQRAERLIAVSEALRRSLMEAWPETEAKCIAIPNGVDTQAPAPRPPDQVRAQLGLPSGARLVGMIARLAPQKGALDFVRAADMLGRSLPGVHFVLAGAGPLREEVESLRAELDLEERLHLVGEIESPRDLLGALEVLVVPSTSEGSSVVAMEAMAVGKPVVATAVGGVPEVVADGETGLLVPPGDSEALAEAVGALLKDEARAADMGDRARQRAAAQFDVRLMIERTEAVYADILREEIENEEGAR